MWHWQAIHTDEPAGSSHIMTKTNAETLRTVAYWPGTFSEVLVNNGDLVILWRAKSGGGAFIWVAYKVKK